MHVKKGKYDTNITHFNWVMKDTKIMCVKRVIHDTKIIGFNLDIPVPSIPCVKRVKYYMFKLGLELHKH